MAEVTTTPEPDLSDPPASTSPADPGGVDRLAGQLRESEERQRAILAEGESKLEPLYKRVNETIAKPHPAQPQLQPVGKAPEPPDKNGEAAGQWLNATLVLSAIAGAFSRNSATVAMNAFAGAINGYREGSLQKFETEYKAWKAASEKTIENNKIVTDQYQRVLADRKLALDEQMAQIQMIATQYRDRVMFEASGAKNYTLVAQMLEKQREFEVKMKNEMDKIDARHQARMEEIGFQSQNKLNSVGGIEWYMGLDPEKRERVDQALQKVGGAGGGRGMRLSDEQIATISDNIASGKLPPTFQGLYGYNRGAIEADFSKRHPEASITQLALDYKRAEKEISALNSTQMTRFVGAARSVIGTIDRAEASARELGLSGIAPLNRARLEYLAHYRSNTKEGQTAIKYLNDVNAVKEEMAQVITGGYAPTDNVWNLANQQINSAYGVEGLSTALREVKRILGYRIAAIPGIESIGPGAPNRFLPNVTAPAPTSTTTQPPAGAPPGGAAAAPGADPFAGATMEVH